MKKTAMAASARSSSSRATTSSTRCGGCWRMPSGPAWAGAISSSTPLAPARATPSPGSRINWWGLTDTVAERPVFDSVIVVTDRTVLDKQIRDTVRQFAHVAGVVQPITEGSRQLRQALEDGKKIIITTIQKFPYIVQDVAALGEKRFAIIIDEAHSSQSGRAAAQLNVALSRSESGTATATTMTANRATARKRDHRGPDQPHHRIAAAADQRQLLRLHRHAQEQDARNLRLAQRRRRQVPPLPHLLHEAGHRGGVHSRRAAKLHHL